MTSSPRVTVLLTVHNGASYIEASLQSLLAQTFEDVELLVVDDASLDGTAELVERLGDPRVRLHRNDRNLGIPASANVGLELARGSYVARADHDDLSHPRRLELEVAALDANSKLAVVGTWFDVIDADGRVLAQPRADIRDFVDFVYLLLIDRSPLHQPTTMFRREAVLKLGGYDEEMHIAEDKDLWRRLALARCGAQVIREPLLRYRVHASQITQTRFQTGRELDALSYERFLAQLDHAAPRRMLRLLLTGQPEAWNEITSPADAAEIARAVTNLAHAAAEKLELDTVEEAKLVERLTERLRQTSLLAWRHSLMAQWRLAPRLRASAAGGDREHLRGDRGRFVALMAGAPILVALETFGRPALRRLLRGRPLRGIRARAALSPTLRRAYASLLGSRDDRPM
jgi:hypothetical protein